MRNKFATTLAVATIASAPAIAGAETIYGLTNLQELVIFDSSSRVVTSTKGLAGFSVSGEFLVSIDTRPATGELFGFSNQNKLYKINPVNGNSTGVGAAIAGLSGSAKSIDFNPTVDRVRLITSGGNNLRLVPDTGAVAFTDTNLAFASADGNAGDTPAVVNGAYTNSFAGATTTTLYDIEALNNVLATQAPPNAGTLNTVGAGLGFDVVDSAGFTGFDISGATGTAYLVGNQLFGAGGLTPNSLYTVNLTSGTASLSGAVTGVNGVFRDLAVASAVPEPASLALVATAGAALLARRRARAR